MTRRFVLLLMGGLLLASCGGSPGGEETPETSAVPEQAQEAVSSTAAAPPAEEQLAVILGRRLEARQHDLQGVKELGILRVLVGYSHTHYFMDGLRLRGISAENLRQFEPVLQKGLGNPQPKTNVLPLPVARSIFSPKATAIWLSATSRLPRSGQSGSSSPCRSGATSRR